MLILLRFQDLFFLFFKISDLMVYKNLLKFTQLLFLVLTTNLLWSQGAVLKGKVLDAKTKEPIIGAFVESGTQGVSTDAEGLFELNLPLGVQPVVISYTGFEPYKTQVAIKEGANAELLVSLEETATILQQATVTSSKFEKPLGEVTVSLDVIKPRLAENINATQVNDVIQKVPGVSIIDGQANIRGGSGYSYGAGSRVLLLLNDMPIMDGAAGMPNWRDLPIENLEQIEVLKGAASALYGSSALNGIINIRTAEPKSTPVLKFSAFTNLYDRPGRLDSLGTTIPFNLNGIPSVPFETGISMAYRKRFNRLDFTSSSMMYTNEDFKGSINERKFRIYGDLKYRLTDKSSLGVAVNFNLGSSRSFLLPDNLFRGLYQPLAGTNTQTKSVRFNIDPYFHLYDKAGGKHKILTRWLHVENNNDNNQANTSDVFYGEYQYAQTLFTKLNLVTGVASNYTRGGGPLYGGGITSQNVAPYLQLDYKIGKLSLSGGARFEYFAMQSADTIVQGFDFNPITGLLDAPRRILNPSPRTSEGRPVFRLGANYKAAEYTYLRASWGQGYRFPSIAERFIATSLVTPFLPLDIRPNPSLKSETGWSAEIGIKQGVKITNNWKGFVDLSAFWTEYNNMMEFSFLSDSRSLYFQSINIGDTRIRGFETSVMGQGNIGQVKFNILAGYTYIDPQYQDFNALAKSYTSDTTQNVLKYRFRHTAKFDAEMFYKGFSLGASYQYLSYMDAIDGIFNFFISGLAQYRTINKGQGTSMLDFRTSYQVNKHFKVSFIVKNILNTVSVIRPGMPDPTRSVNIRLDYNVFGQQ